jgi:hypothetical protein
MVVIQGIRPVLAGVACGLTAAFGLARGLASFLFGVKPWDPLVFLVVPVILVLRCLPYVCQHCGQVGSIPSRRYGMNKSD